MSVSLRDVLTGEDVFGYIHRVRGCFDQRLYQQVLGAANAFKEGDASLGIAAGVALAGRVDDACSRKNVQPGISDRTPWCTSTSKMTAPP